jgi:hypothetical protein
MKNFKMLGLVGLGCGALLLTGCGGSGHKLKCEQKTDNQEITLEVVYNSDETKAEKATMDMIIPIPDGTSDEEIQQAKSMLELSCSAGTYDKCEVKQSKSSLTMHIEGSAQSLGGVEESKSLKDAKTELEQSGYTCK